VLVWEFPLQLSEEYYCFSAFIYTYDFIIFCYSFSYKLMKENSRIPSPVPLIAPDKEVDWWFAFKFNASEEPGNPEDMGEKGLFDAPGIEKSHYDTSGKKFSRHYLFSSSANPSLQLGKGGNVIGGGLDDPLGATFGQVYLNKKPPYFVVWNDQFKGDPIKNRDSPWGHSKGMLAWNDDGEGIVLQVSTPSWPGAGNQKFPRKTDGNTLGFVHDDDIEVSQHFFALKLTKDDVLDVVSSLHNASVCTAQIPQLINNGGPAPIRKLVGLLGNRDRGRECLNLKLSSGVRLISKPSSLWVPPWQLVSAELGGIDLRVACWWTHPKIYSSKKGDTMPGCWFDPSDQYKGKPGVVEIATTGTWPPDCGKTGNLGMKGGPGAKYNHAKIGVSTTPGTSYSIFGDMNQQGAFSPGHTGSKCSSSQNGRGGLFFAMDDPKLFASVSGLLKGESAPVD